MLNNNMNLIYKHSKKAISKGNPSDRLFVVVSNVNGEFLAWKCVDKGNNNIWHPALGDCLINDENIFNEQSENGSKPTALFKPDSFYELVIK